MGTAENVKKVQKNISNAYEKKRIKLYALSLDYAGRVINDFRAQQPDGQFNRGFWTNQTTNARRTMFTKAYNNKNEVGFFMSHMMRYGIYLELANDRQNEAIRPIINKWAPKYFKAAREII